MFHDALKPEDNYALVLNDLNSGNFSAPGWQQPGSGPWKSSKSPYETFKEWAADNGYTEMKIGIQRYGYSWNYTGRPVKLATVVLTLHGLLCLGHMLVILAGGRTFPAWGSLDEILVLAWNSKPAEGLRNTSAGVARILTCRNVVRIQETQEERLQLVLAQRIGDGEEARRKPKVAFKYA